MIRVLGCLAFLALLAFLLRTDRGSYLVYYDISSIIFVTGSIVALALARHGVKGFYPMTEERISSLMSISIAVGCAGFTFGLVQILGGLALPEEVGPATAEALFSMVYSFVVVILLYCWKGSATQHHLPFYSVLSVVCAGIVTVVIYQQMSPN